MRRFLLKINAFIKSLVIGARPNYVFGFLIRPAMSISNTLSMTRWIHKNKNAEMYNDFFSPKRDYSKRCLLHENIIEKYELDKTPFEYLEFGVFEGNSFKWWLNRCSNEAHKFFGFDTFEGLPESWGSYAKGEMFAQLPDINDSRAKLYKGLFQDTLPFFLKKEELLNQNRKIIHLDADLFSSTIFALTSLAPYLKKGDILLFDEFNVPNHEYFAFKIFVESYYIKYKMIGAVNNYYQVAIMIG